MARRKSNLAHRDTPDTNAPIPPTTIKLGWGDKRMSQVRGAGLYVYLGKRFMFQSFDTLCTAKHFITLMIDGDDFTWDIWAPARGIGPEPMIRTARGLTIRGAGLEAAMEYEFESDAERSFIFPEPYNRMYEFFPRRGTEETEPTPPAPVETKYDPDTGEVIKMRAGKPIVKAEPKPKKEPKPKVDKTGLTTVQEIAVTLKADPKHCRAALRKAKVEKPAVGWAFPKADVARITKLIKDNLK